MAKEWSRRQVLGSALAGAASLAAGVPAWAAAKTLNVLGHRVHQNSLTTGVAGDLTKPWRDSHDAEIVCWDGTSRIPKVVAHYAGPDMVLK